MSTEMKRLKILAPTRYPWRFNGPRETVHDIQVRKFIPFNRLSHQIEGVTVFNPFPIEHFDLLHAFNRIPLWIKPFIIGFESHLPRGFGIEGTRFYSWMTQQLVANRCKKIVAISEHARAIFLRAHQNHPQLDVLKSKLIVRYPNVIAPQAEAPVAELPSDPIVMTFIGNHFGRKGGCVAVKMAEMAFQKKLPLIVNIVSTLEAGGPIWTDPADTSFFEPYFKLLALPNVRHFQNLPNDRVLDLLRGSHFSLLTTFGDTFGYSAIESMINATPSIATRQGALPEFIEDGVNGILLDLPVDEVGELKRPDNAPRDSARFQQFYTGEIERLAEQALQRVMAVMEEDGKLQLMRTHARQDAIVKFNHRDASNFWDRLYVDVLDEHSAQRASSKSNRRLAI